MCSDTAVLETLVRRCCLPRSLDSSSATSAPGSELGVSLSSRLSIPCWCSGGTKMVERALASSGVTADKPELYGLPSELRLGAGCFQARLLL